MSERKTNGLLFYSLLRKEAYRVNRELNKPLSHKKVETLIKQKLFPAYRGKGYSRVRKSDLRERVTSILKSATRKKNTGRKLYGRLLHEITVANNSIPEPQRLPIAKRRQIVSEIYYPKYKAKPFRSLDWIRIRKLINKHVKELTYSCNISDIPANTYQQIEFFRIDSFISENIPKCIFLEVNAGKYGRTEIFNTRDYNYYGNGVQQITNNINKAVKLGELKIDTTDIPSYNGEIQIRTSRKNDGKPDSYYLTMILEIKGKPVEEPELVTPPKIKRTKKQKEIAKTTMAEANRRVKEMTPEKSNAKRVRRQLSQRIHDAKFERKAILRLIKNGLIKKGILKQFETVFHNEEKRKIDRAKKNKIIKEYQYQELLSQIKNAFK